MGASHLLSYNSFSSLPVRDHLVDFSVRRPRQRYPELALRLPLDLSRKLLLSLLELADQRRQLLRQRRAHVRFNSFFTRRGRLLPSKFF